MSPGSDHWYVVILAGGVGSRFWPLSRPDRPKPFLALTGRDTLLQLTYRRALQVVPRSRILVVANQRHGRLVREQLPALPVRQCLLEPVGRNTAPAIGWAATWLLERDPEAAMVVMPADHHIGQAAQFLRSLQRAQRLAVATRGLVTLGVAPTRPATAYGYLELGRRVHNGFQVIRFIEKPSLAQAKRLVTNRRICWNSGIFLWRADVLLAQIRRYLPQLAKVLDRIQAARYRTVARWYPHAPAISVDYGILERAHPVYAVPARFDWMDLGSWGALADVTKRDRWSNFVVGPHQGIKTRRTIVVNQSGQRVATIGLDRAIVVTTPEAVLVCAREEDQEVRRLAEAFPPAR